MPVCAIMWCKKKSRLSNISTDGVTFHRFPRSPIREEKWKASTGRPDTWFPTKNSAICSNHFEDSCFYQHGSTRRLYEKSVPTLNLPALVSTIEEESLDIKTEVDDDIGDDNYQELMSPEQDELKETIKTSINFKVEVNDHDYEKPPSPKLVQLGGQRFQIVGLNQCNNIGKLRPSMAHKPNSTTSILRQRLQPIALKLTSATVIGSLRPIAPRLGPGTLIPVNLKPLLNQQTSHNLNETGINNLVSIQPIKPANFALTSMPKAQSTPVVTALNTPATLQASSSAQNEYNDIQIMKPGSSQEREQKNNKSGSISENVLQINRERVMKREIEHLKYFLNKKRQTIKCLHEQNRLWRNKVKSLKIMLQSLIKIKK